MRVLLVEDEPSLSTPLIEGLRDAGHRVDLCESGRDALEQARALAYDVVILDWMLPQMDGLAVLRAWRRDGMGAPVLMLTARGSVRERVLGLRAGADDYLAKPFAFDELLARIEALHRRSQGTTVRLEVGDLTLDTRRRALRRGETEISLTAREFGLANAFFEHAGEVMTRAELLGRVWGAGFDGEPNIVDVYVGYLRRKLERLDAQAGLHTVRGMGWRLEAKR